MRGVTRWVVLLPLAIIAAYAVLLPLGEWQMDEFVLLHGLQQQGFAYVAARLQTWSPRPLSELILWLYQLCVARLDRPLITSILAFLWLLLLGAAFAASRWPRLRGPRLHGADAVAIPTPIAPGLAVAALVACYLLLGKPGVFYWPAGAIAYVPTLAAATFAAVAVGLVPDIEAWSVRARAVLCAALVIAASSSEMGAMFVLLNGTGQMLRSVVATWPRSPQPGARNIGSLVKTAWVWLLPGTIAALLLVTFRQHRAGTHEAIPAMVPTLHELPASLAAGARKFAQELIGVPMGPGGAWLGAAIKLCLFLGFRPRLTGIAYRSRGTSLIQSAALLGAGFFSVVFAYWQFGAACCERHETMRQCFIVLALFAAACAVPVNASPSGKHDWLRSERLQAALLALPLLVLTATRAPDLAHGYTRIPATIAARAATWRSGLACCTSVMEWYNPPHAQLMTAYALRPGIYARLPPGTAPGDPTARDASDILVFFGKSSLLVH